MSWFTIIKNPKLRVGNKITTNLGIDSKEEDDSCERKLREYVNKVSSPFSIVKEGIPEEIHCKALKTLNKVLDMNQQTTKQRGGNNYHYLVSSSYDQIMDNNKVVWTVFCELEIYKNRDFYVSFELTVNDSRKEFPVIILYHSTEYGDTLDIDNIDYAKVKEIDFR